MPACTCVLMSTIVLNDIIRAISNCSVASNGDSGSDAESSVAKPKSQVDNGSESKGKQRGRPKRQSAVKPATPPPVEDEEEEEGEGDEDDEDMDEDVYEDHQSGPLNHRCLLICY